MISKNTAQIDVSVHKESQDHSFTLKRDLPKVEFSYVVFTCGIY